MKQKTKLMNFQVELNTREQVFVTMADVLNEQESNEWVPIDLVSIADELGIHPATVRSYMKEFTNLGLIRRWYGGRRNLDNGKVVRSPSRFKWNDGNGCKSLRPNEASLSSKLPHLQVVVPQRSEPVEFLYTIKMGAKSLSCNKSEAFVGRSRSTSVLKKKNIEFTLSQSNSCSSELLEATLVAQKSPNIVNKESRPISGEVEFKNDNIIHPAEPIAQEIARVSEQLGAEEAWWVRRYKCSNIKPTGKEIQIYDNLIERIHNLYAQMGEI